MEWSIVENRGSGWEEVRVRGDCDLYSAPGFAREILERLGTGQRAFRFELSGLSYLDSTGVGALIRIIQAARIKGVELRFRGLRGSPRKVLEMSNVIALMREEA